MSKCTVVQSHRGPYELIRNASLDEILALESNGRVYWLVDDVLPRLGYFKDFPDFENVITICAAEESKSVEFIFPLVEQLLAKGLKRDAVLVAVGGGVIQDITCFIASIFMRGIDWYFVPTTLLAQCDSCIGSKSSINFGSYKNIFGTFKPPKKIFQAPFFLASLSSIEIQSGIGEILKVSLIDSRSTFDDATSKIKRMQTDQACLQQYIDHALAVKVKYVEQDEFDQGERIVFNLGHTFGHALEAASQFKLPHGVAVALGIYFAFWLSESEGLILPLCTKDSPNRILHDFGGYLKTRIDLSLFLAALRRDKKNKQAQYGFILPAGKEFELSLHYLPMSQDLDNKLISCLKDTFVAAR